MELHLPARLAVEFDALFRHFRYSYFYHVPLGTTTITSATSNAWEFPLLLKYRLPGRLTRPYFDGGVAWDRLQGLSANETYYPFFGPPIKSSNSEALQNTTVTGVVLGVGVEVHFLFLHIAPELRYTRWTSQHFTLPGLIGSSQNQAEFLVGITF